MSDSSADAQGKSWRSLFEWRLPEEHEREPPEPPWTRLDVLRLVVMASLLLLNVVPWGGDRGVGWPWRRAVLVAAPPLLPGPPGETYAWFTSYEAETDWPATAVDAAVCLTLVGLTSGVKRLGVAGQPGKLSLHGVMCLLIGSAFFFALAPRWPAWWAWPLLLPAMLAFAGAVAWAFYGLEVIRRRAINPASSSSPSGDDSKPSD